jgi:hypothetical protein
VRRELVDQVDDAGSFLIRREDTTFRQNPIAQLFRIFTNSRKKFLASLTDQAPS